MSTSLPILEARPTPLGWTIAWLATSAAALAIGALSFRYLLRMCPIRSEAQT